MPGLVPGMTTARGAFSVLRDDRAAESVVDAGGDQINVLADAVSARERADRRQRAVGGERDVVTAHEQMVVFEADRPVRGEAVFDADADRAAPAGVVGTIELGSGQTTRSDAAVAIAGDGGAALHVKQCVIPGVADLAREQAESIDAGAVRDAGYGAGVPAREIGPVALCFEAEHEGAVLPAITDLAAGDGARRVMAAFRNAGRETNSLVPAIARRAIAAVGANVEAAPIIDRRDHRRRLGVGTGGEICGTGLGRDGCEREAGERGCNLPIHVCPESSMRWANIPVDG